MNPQFNNGWETDKRCLRLLTHAMLERLTDIGLHPDKPFALVRLRRTFGGRVAASFFDRYASREEASARLIVLVRSSNPAVIETAPQALAPAPRLSANDRPYGVASARLADDRERRLAEVG